MNKTKIEWCDSTWNPVTGCLHECEYCYARKIAVRFGKRIPDEISTDTIGSLHWLDRKFDNPYPFIFEPTMHSYRRREPQKKTNPQNIFVCSMADLFGEWIPEDWIKIVFKSCELAPQHNYLFLTKNPKRYFELAEKGLLPERDNMLYGTTITTPDEPYFWSDSHNTFVSIEPISASFPNTSVDDLKRHTNWIIVGAETGTRKNKIVPKAEWISPIIECCKHSGVPLFMKDSLIPIIGEENMIRQIPAKPWR